jgi:SAM-dependent methyltransferase
MMQPQSAIAHPVAGARADADQIRAFYDDHVVHKVADFVDGNPRVEAAWRTIEEWAPASPAAILDIGCGFGQISWRMATRWPAAHVTGLDISPRSVALAAKVFQHPNLGYVATSLDAIGRDGGYDLITLIDVYEHIADADRAAFNASLAGLLAPAGVLILTFPTPAYQERLRANEPAKLQPVDEDIDLPKLQALAAATGTRLVMYGERSVWLSGDYAHAVLSRHQPGVPVPRPAPSSPTVVDRAVRKLRTALRGAEAGSRESRLELIERALGPGAYRPR